VLKKTITFEDLDGHTITEDFYFNFSKAEIVEMQLSHLGGLESFLKTIIASRDGATLVQTFKEIVGQAYGVRAEDGRRFIKSDELTEAFMQTDAWSILFVELMSDPAKSAEFIAGLMPTDMRADALTKATEAISNPELVLGQGVGSWSEPRLGEGAVLTPENVIDKQPNQRDLESLSQSELIELLRAQDRN
jgi:hypothetical protein